MEFKTVKDKITALELAKEAGAINELNEKLLIELKKLLVIAEKWNDLDKEIGAYYEGDYEDESDNESEFGLIEIGEAAATAFGYL